jgi:ABC-type methionine transport system permease subunit
MDKKSIGTMLGITAAIVLALIITPYVAKLFNAAYSKVSGG